MTVLEIYLEILTNVFEILYPPLPKHIQTQTHRGTNSLSEKTNCQYARLKQNMHPKKIDKIDDKRDLMTRVA